MLQDGNLQGCLDALHKSMGLSTDLEDSSGDADVLGAIGDTYTDLGDLEKAAEVWHRQLYMQVRKCCSTTLVLQAWEVLQHVLGALKGRLGPCNYAAISRALLLSKRHAYLWCKVSCICNARRLATTAASLTLHFATLIQPCWGCNAQSRLKEEIACRHLT